MKVGELIKELSKFPSEYECVATWEGITTDFDAEFIYLVDDVVFIDTDDTDAELDNEYYDPEHDIRLSYKKQFQGGER